jgi:thiamine transport system permease protein
MDRAMDRHRSSIERPAKSASPLPTSSWWLAAPALVAVIAVVVWPTVTVLGRGSFSELWPVLASSRFRSIIAFTVAQALLSAAATVVIGVCFVEALARRCTGSRWLRGLLLAPFALPSVVVGSAVGALSDGAGLGRSATVGWITIVTAHVLFNVSVVVRVVGDRRASLDDRLLAAAATLGCNAVTRWRLVTWPHVRSAVANSAALVALFCLSSYGVVIVLGASGQRTIEIEVVRQVNDRLRLDRAGALVLVQLAIMVVVLMLASRLSRSDHSGSARIWWLGQLSRRWSLAAWLGALTLIAGPLVALGLRSMRINGWTARAYVNLASDLPGVGFTGIEVLWRSASVAVVAALIALALAVPAGLVIAGGGPAAKAVSIACVAPIVISTVVIGVGILVRFDSSMANLRSRWIAIPMTHALAALPVAARLVATARRRIDDRYLAAAATLGASPWQRARWVLTPLLSGTVVAAGSFAAAVSLGDFGAASVLARSGTPPLPVAIGRLLGRPGAEPYATAAALGCLLAVLCGALGALEARRES